MSSDTDTRSAICRSAISPPDERRFWRKVRRVLARIPFAEDLLAAYFCAIDRNTPTYVRGILLRRGRLFRPARGHDPDLLGPLGFTDDASVIAAALAAVGSHLRPQHRVAARDRLDQLAS